MKLKKKEKDSFAAVKAKSTEVKRLDTAKVEIWHTQEVRQSANYQSASASYGVKLIVEDNQAAIQAGIARAEELVETPLTDKLQQQRELLQNLSNE